jgi:hypothetical protein
MRRGLDLFRVARPTNHPDVVHAALELAALLEGRGNPAAAKALAEEVSAMCRAVGPRAAREAAQAAALLSRIGEAKPGGGGGPVEPDH